MNYKFINKPFKTEAVYCDILNTPYCIKLLVYNDIKFKIKKGYKSTDNKYAIIVCEMSKKYKPKFIEVMSELRKNILISGYNDYDEFCERELPTIVE